MSGAGAGAGRAPGRRESRGCCDLDGGHRSDFTGPRHLTANKRSGSDIALCRIQLCSLLLLCGCVSGEAGGSKCRRPAPSTPVSAAAVGTRALRSRLHRKAAAQPAAAVHLGSQGGCGLGTAVQGHRVVAQLSNLTGGLSLLFLECVIPSGYTLCVHWCFPKRLC